MTYFTLVTLCEASHNVTKSTTCVNLGIGLARQGKKVLIVDNDPQGVFYYGQTKHLSKKQGNASAA